MAKRRKSLRYKCLSCGHEWPLLSDNCPQCSSTNWASRKTLEAAEVQRNTARAARLLDQPRNYAEALLLKHELSIPESTVDMLIKLIRNCHVLVPKPKSIKGVKPSARERLETAHTHGSRLLMYAESPPSRMTSMSTRSKALLDALDTVDTAVHLVPIRDATGEAVVPEIDLSKLLIGLRTGEPDTTELANLVQALNSILSHDGKRTGRPWSRSTYIVRAGYIAWRRSGRTEEFTWNGTAGELKGPLPDFLRDLFATCQQKAPNDKSLQMQLLDCKKDNDLQTWLTQKSRT